MREIKLTQKEEINFKERFPNKIAEVVDDFSGSILTHLKEKWKDEERNRIISIINDLERGGELNEEHDEVRENTIMEILDNLTKNL